MMGSQSYTCQSLIIQTQSCKPSDYVFVTIRQIYSHLMQLISCERITLLCSSHLEKHLFHISRFDDVYLYRHKSILTNNNNKTRHTLYKTYMNQLSYSSKTPCEVSVIILIFHTMELSSKQSTVNEYPSIIATIILRISLQVYCS